MPSGAAGYQRARGICTGGSSSVRGSIRAGPFPNQPAFRPDRRVERRIARDDDDEAVRISPPRRLQNCETVGTRQIKVGDHQRKTAGRPLQHLNRIAAIFSPGHPETESIEVLEQQFPHLVTRYEKLYAVKYPPEAYRKEVKAVVLALQDRYGLGRRPAIEKGEAADAASPGQADPNAIEAGKAQSAFMWER